MDLVKKLSELLLLCFFQTGCLSDALGLDTIEGSSPDESDSMDIDPSASMLSLSDLASSMTSEDGQLGRPRSLRWGLNRRHRWISRSCRSFRFNLSGPPPAAMPVSHPFCGTLASQLKCTECGYKSVVRYDKFESLTLTLPCGMGDLGWGRHKLHQLLANFVSAEEVTDVACDGCNRGRSSTMPPILSKQTKVQQFGKLPSCLCIHISRNTWHASGNMSKRQDYVQFPVRLSLTAYTFLQSQFLARPHGTTSEGGSPLSYSVPSSWGTASAHVQHLHDSGSRDWRHLYQLAAVVVHIGDAHGGHFATYRRGHHSTISKWFYTSDVEIREATIDEVLKSTAYMLFYEKCSALLTM